VDEVDADLRAAIEAFVLDELAAWPNLTEVLRTSALEQTARQAREDAEALAFLEMVWEQEEATCSAVVWEEECHARLFWEA
jgi:acyl-CoA reductase-like NAD-dependent aldehyde dehydrogenase